MGDTGAGWSFLADHLGLKHVDCVFPTAQTLPVTLNGGMSMPSWFDIKGLNYTADVMDHGQVAESVAYLHELIEAQKAKGIAADRIVVGGFSQGGNIALKAFMSSKEKLGGCVALSTWLEPGSAYEKEVLQNEGAPIMWGHGVADPMVPAVLGTNSVLHLRKLAILSSACGSWANASRHGAAEHCKRSERVRLAGPPLDPCLSLYLCRSSVASSRRFLKMRSRAPLRPI